MGSAPLKKVLTKVWLTMASPGKESVELKSRPLRSCIFIVPSQPGEMVRNQPQVSVGGPALMEIEPFHELPGDMSGQPPIATSLIPGTARGGSAICDHNSATSPRRACASLRTSSLHSIPS